MGIGLQSLSSTRLEQTEKLAVDFVSSELELEALGWLRRHDEREYSFVDATSFALMRSLRIGRHSPSTATSRPPASPSYGPPRRLQLLGTRYSGLGGGVASGSRIARAPLSERPGLGAVPKALEACASSRYHFERRPRRLVYRSFGRAECSPARSN